SFFHSSSVFVIFSTGCVEGEVLGGAEACAGLAPSPGAPPPQPAKANSPTIITPQARQIECFMASQQSEWPRKYSIDFSIVAPGMQRNAPRRKHRLPDRGAFPSLNCREARSLPRADSVAPAAQRQQAQAR